MFTRQIFETLPIALIALSILLMALVHTPLALFAGCAMILLNCVVLYRRYIELGTDPDVLDYVPASSESA
jgi:hypothetical protein